MLALGKEIGNGNSVQKARARDKLTMEMCEFFTIFIIRILWYFMNYFFVVNEAANNRNAIKGKVVFKIYKDIKRLGFFDFICRSFNF